MSKRHIKTKAGTVTVYEKSIVFEGITMFLNEPPNDHFLKGIKRALDAACVTGYERRSGEVANALRDLIHGKPKWLKS